MPSQPLSTVEQATASVPPLWIVAAGWNARLSGQLAPHWLEAHSAAVQRSVRSAVADIEVRHGLGSQVSMLLSW